MAGSTFLKGIPGDARAFVSSIAHAAATVTEVIAAWAAPYACRIKAVGFIPAAAVTGANTNTTHLNVINKGAAGSGTTEIGNYDLTSGNNLAATDVYWIATGLTTAMAEDDVLALTAEKVGTGLDVPAGTFVIVYDGGGALA